MSAGVIIPDSSVALKYHVDKMAKAFISKASLKTNKRFVAQMLWGFVINRVITILQQTWQLLCCCADLKLSLDCACGIDLLGMCFGL